MNEGIRRLSIFLGTIGALAWLTIVVVDTEFFSEIYEPLRFWRLCVGIWILSFLVPFGFVRAIAWVIIGFKQSGAKQQTGLPNKPNAGDD